MSCFNVNRRPIKIIADTCCGLCVISKSSTCCTSICCKVTYTINIRNNCNNTCKCACLHVPLDGVLCLDPSTILVNGEHVDVTCLDSIPLGDIEPNQEMVVVYTVTVVQYKRYIKTRALVTFFICCCCERNDLGVYSNCNCVQCCPCCCCCNQTT